MTTESDSLREPRRRLERVETFLDVAYAVLVVDFIMYLPHTEDMAWAELPLGLLSLLIDNSVELLRIVIAVGLTLISWNLTHKLLGALERTNGRHTLLVLFQFLFVCLFLFFAIADPNLAGGPSSPAGQSICLALSGFIGIAAYRYAAKQGFADPALSEADQNEIAQSASVEPTTALLNTGLAFVGPGAWTLGWFLIPIVVVWVRRRIGGRDSP